MGPNVNPRSQNQVNVHYIDIEARVKPSANAPVEVLRNELTRILEEVIGKRLRESDGDVDMFLLELQELLHQDVRIKACMDHLVLESNAGRRSFAVQELAEDTEWRMYFYKFTNELPSEEMDKDGDVTTYVQTALPSREFSTLWDSLCYDSDLKQDLLNYAEDAVMFSQAQVDPNLVSWNKVVLLHGPAGTGKTSLCKALAQKLAIRLSDRYKCTYLMEINSHSLFSRWFSESGKQVMKLFDAVEQVITRGHFVCLLIDEVESLARARQAMSSGNEPSDAVRVVNALLTQLDKLKRHPNVLILTTSNISDTIDLAFMDRTDIKFFVGHPTASAIRSIYTSVLTELQHKGVLDYKVPLDMVPIEDLIESSGGLSGRTLRKIPFLTHAAHFSGQMSIDPERFVQKMRLTVEKHRHHSQLVGSTNGIH